MSLLSSYIICDVRNKTYTKKENFYTQSKQFHTSINIEKKNRKNSSTNKSK